MFTSDEILAFERRARKQGILNLNQANCAFYEDETSEYYIVRNFNEKRTKASIEFIPLFLDITEVTILRPMMKDKL
jgi:hypothetical protein